MEITQEAWDEIRKALKFVLENGFGKVTIHINNKAIVRITKEDSKLIEK